MIGVKRGLFGRKPMTGATMGGFGGGTFNMDGTPVDEMPHNYPQAEAPQGKGMFGGGTVRAIAGTIGDTLLQHNGMDPVYAPTMQAQRAAAAKLADEQRQRSLKRDDFMFEHNYRVNNPTPQRDDTFTRTLEAAGIDPNSEQGRALYRQRAETLANPVQWVTGQDGIPRPMPRSSPITAPPGVTFTPIDEGGPSQQATGGFREAFAGF